MAGSYRGDPERSTTRPGPAATAKVHPTATRWSRGGVTQVTSGRDGPGVSWLTTLFRSLGNAGAQANVRRRAGVPPARGLGHRGPGPAPRGPAALRPSPPSPPPSRRPTAPLPLGRRPTGAGLVAVVPPLEQQAAAGDHDDGDDARPDDVGRLRGVAVVALVGLEGGAGQVGVAARDRRLGGGRGAMGGGRGGTGSPRRPRRAVRTRQATRAPKVAVRRIPSP